MEVRHGAKTPKHEYGTDYPTVSDPAVACTDLLNEGAGTLHPDTNMAHSAMAVGGHLEDVEITLPTKPPSIRSGRR